MPSLNKRLKAAIFFVVSGGFVLFLVSTLIVQRRQSLEHLVKVGQKRCAPDAPCREFSYGIYVMNIAAGELKLGIQESPYQDREALEAHLSLRPFKFLRAISSDGIGVDGVSFFNKENLLPYLFEQTTPYAMRKGKTGKTIEYHHGERWMLRKAKKEDIEEDTRDPVSLIVWLMSRDYENEDLFKSTLNINRKIYTVVGKVGERRSLVKDGIETRLMKLKLKILGRDAGYRLRSQLPVEVYLLQRGEVYVPILFDIKMGWLHITAALS